ncbi:MAG TPA: FAD-dependent oxidoreductase [Myxococcaceae bacterium]|nr:FAD-dependent oxidoreductase [Myxococcaceae bacterium]
MKVEVVIAGAGPAGLAAATHAARAGLSVAVFDREELPHDKACGEGLMPPGVRALERLGARSALTDRDCAPIRGVRYVQEDGSSLEGRLPDGGGLGVRRTALAGALLARARQAGVSVHPRTGVRRHRRTGTAIQVDTDAGVWEASVLVAADGLASPLRAAEGLDLPGRGPRRFGMRQHLRLRPWTDCVEVHLSERLEAYVTPAGADRVGVAFLWEDGRVPPQISWPALVERVPLLAEHVHGADADSVARGAGPLYRRARARVRPRFVLLGDAAGYVDAITGEGLSLALVCAEALARCLPEAVAHGGAPSAFGPYLATCRREYRRYALVAGGMLALARRPWLRRGALGALAGRPAAFSWLLAQAIG